LGAKLSRLLESALAPSDGWKRRVAVLAFGLAMAGGLALAHGKPNTASLKVQPIEIAAEAILSFDKESAGRTQFGKLEWRGGLVLSSPSASFGGWSGLAFDADGETLFAVSDAGTWMTAKLVHEGRRPTALASARIGPLKAREGKPLNRGRDRDAEAVVLAEGTLAKGTLLVAFEQNDRIGRFVVAGGEPAPPSAYLKIPVEVQRMRFDGFEALTVLRGGPFKGSIVALAENRVPGESDHSGWIWIDGVPQRFHLADVGEFAITDAASLADGSLPVLERRFRWSEGVRMRLRRIEAQNLAPSARIEAEVLLEADMGQEIDNMEGLAVREGPSGETLITMISDDNFNALLQRTVLLEFALPAEGKAASATGEEAAAPAQ